MQMQIKALIKKSSNNHKSILSIKAMADLERKLLETIMLNHRKEK